MRPGSIFSTPHGTATAAFAVVTVLVIGTVIFTMTGSKNTKITNANTVSRRCAEELKICPDGSTVTRILPACDFTACLVVDPVTAATDGWLDFTDADAAYSIKYPPTWTVSSKDGVTMISGAGIEPLTIATVVDDAILYESSDHFSLTINGVKVTQADYSINDVTTRMIWFPGTGKFLRLSWPRTETDTPYYQILATLQRK